MADAIGPVWDEGGEYLYLLASTDYGLSTGWLDMTFYDRPVTRALYVALLQEDEPSPFSPRSDEETVDEQESDGQVGDESRDQPEATDDAAIPDVVIDFDGIDRRIVDAPNLPLRNCGRLERGPEGQVFATETIPNQQGFTLHRYDVDEQEAEVFLERADEGTVSHDRKKLLYRSGGNWTLVDTENSPSTGDDGRLSLSGMRILVEPRAEWAQMLRDGWRFMRDFLCVDNVHVAPWDDVWDWYSPWLADVNHRADFNHLLDMVSGEVAVGHSYVRGGDYPDLTDSRTGLFGIDLELQEEADGRYRITRIYSGESWTPGLEGPLAVPGLGVSAGDYVIAIDGVDLRAPDNPFRLMEGNADRTVTITVNGTPSREGARDVIVRPVSSEN